MKSQDRRLISLDVGRGITIMGMLIVNNPGNPNYIYSQFSHVAWNGLHFADLGVPVFLFIVGIALAFSLGRRIEQQVPKSELYKKIVIRTVIIFGLGLFLNAFPFFQAYPFEFKDPASIPVMGVLQRIALSYFFASVIYLESQRPLYLTTWTFGLLLCYQLFLVQLPVPLAFSEWQQVYQSAFGRQFILFVETIPATALVLIGTLTGLLLYSSRSVQKKGAMLLLAGIVFLALGLLASSIWPINKRIMSTPFVLISSGIALMIYSVLYWIIEVRNLQKWTLPFQIFGKNALLVFVGSIMLSELIKVLIFPDGWGNGTIRNIVYYQLFLPVMGAYTASFLYGLLVMMFWLVVMGILYRKKVFIKV